MKKIIAAQQSYAKVNGMTEVCTLEEIAETALAISEGVLRNSNIEVVRNYEKLPPVLVDRHQTHADPRESDLQREARAGGRSMRSRRELLVAIARVEGGVRIEVRDNGVGISRGESRRRSSTTASRPRKRGHGFGLHNCANAAQQMDGSLTAYSDGPGKGASFVLRMPVEYADAMPQRVGFAERGGAQ